MSIDKIKKGDKILLTKDTGETMPKWKVKTMRDGTKYRIMDDGSFKKIKEGQK